MKIKLYQIIRDTSEGLSVDTFTTKEERDQSFIDEITSLLDPDGCPFPSADEAMDALNSSVHESDYVCELVDDYELDIELTPAQAFGALLNGKVVTKPEHRRMLVDMGLNPDALMEQYSPVIYPRSHPNHVKDCRDFSVNVEELLLKEPSNLNLWLQIGGTHINLDIKDTSATLEFYHNIGDGPFHEYTFHYKP